MQLLVERSSVNGSVRIPGSKSHTIRAVALASLAEGKSEILSPLDALDTQSCVHAYRALGSQIELGEAWTVNGTSGRLAAPENVIDIGNSGTSLYVALGSAALCSGWTVFTGDEQIRRRPAQPLLDALNALGAEAFSTRGNGAAPIVVRGPLRGGQAEVDGSKTSQYLTSLLLNCPLAEGDTELRVHNLIEIPYVEMTLAWLASQGIECERKGFEHFHIGGCQHYRAFQRRVPADFSSATFFLCAAAITGSDVTLLGLDMNDSQGDKAVVGMLEEMGATVEVRNDAVRLRGGELHGGEFDLNATPDAVPALAVTACFAEGETRLVNVPQARLKETDRLATMTEELMKMGATITELSDGLIIRGGHLRGAKLRGHSDHRVVMALAVAGLAAEGVTEVDTAESASVTFPNFVELMTSLGARMRVYG